MENAPALSSRNENLSVSALLKQDAYADRFREVLKDNAPQFMSSIIQVSRQLGPDCDAKSIIGSAMVAAAVNLPIDKNLGFAWIIPYNDKRSGKKVAQFQMGYKGYVQLALRTNEYKFLNVCTIYKGQLIGLDALKGDIQIDMTKKESDEVIGYAAYMELNSGFRHAEYWDVKTVETHAKKYSQSYRSNYDSPWKSDFDAMARKTVLSSMIRHWGPMSVGINKVSAADSALIKDIDASPDYIDSLTEQPQQQVPALEDAKPAKAVEVKAQPVIEQQPEPAVETTVIETMMEPLPPAEPDELSPNDKLITALAGKKVPTDVFGSFINVNGYDKKFKFNAMETKIEKWPTEACAAYLADADMMEKRINRLASKK